MEDNSIFKAGGTKVDAKTQMTNGGVYAEDWKLSAQNQTFLQRGSILLAAGSQRVYLPKPYLSAKFAQNITFIVTSQTANHMYVDQIISSTTFGTTNISSISGFVVLGTGTDSGFWLTMGYK